MRFREVLASAAAPSLQENSMSNLPYNDPNRYRRDQPDKPVFSAREWKWIGIGLAIALFAGIAFWAWAEATTRESTRRYHERMQRIREDTAAGTVQPQPKAAPRLPANEFEEAQRKRLADVEKAIGKGTGEGADACLAIKRRVASTRLADLTANDLAAVERCNAAGF
jgi:hypothetical protein